MSSKKNKRTPTPLKAVSMDDRLDALASGPILDADGNEVDAKVIEPVGLDDCARGNVEDVIDYDVKKPNPDKAPWSGPIPEDATPENCPLKPARGHLVIVRESPAHERGRLIVPKGEQQQRSRELMAEVWIMAIGEDDVHISGALLKPCCKVGDRCLTRGANPFATHKTKGSETVFELLPFEAVVAVLDEGTEAEPPMLRMLGDGVQ